MPKRETPAHWMDFMSRHGIRSIRGLAETINVPPNTAARLVHGDTTPAEATLVKIAEAYKVPLAEVYELIGRDADVAEVWTPPPEANQLTRGQRKHLEGLIRAIVNRDE